MINRKQFGGKATSADIARYETSPNWRDGSFQNIEETSATPSFFDTPKIIYKMIKGAVEKEPPSPLPIETFDREAFELEADGPRFIWYGHSALLLRLGGKTIFIDPMMGPDCSPIGPIRTKRFSHNTLDIIDTLLRLFIHFFEIVLQFKTSKKGENRHSTATVVWRVGDETGVGGGLWRWHGWSVSIFWAPFF
jgi:hypothetical protein